jgi:cytochrome c peroxidase
MADSTLAQAQQLVDQLPPHNQVRLLAYLTTRLARVVTALRSTEGGTPPETSDVWETFFQFGEMLPATDTPERETVWGSQAFRIDWPADIDQVCSSAVPPRPNARGPVKLSQVDRDRANATYDQFGLAIAAYEAAPDVSPFSSKFDYALANPDQQVLSTDELAGWELFRGKAKCNTCHLDGTENRGKQDVGGGPMTPGDAAGVAPLFTDFTSSNLGLPKNVAIPYYYETTLDSFGFTPNPQGFAFIDKGVGDLLRGALNPNAGWTQYADRFDGKMQNPTLCNVDMRPYPEFVKAYMHNGYLKSLQEVVHFSITRAIP